jgi:hypothetical protein
LVAQPPGVEAQGIGGAGRFPDRLVPRIHEAGAAAGGRKHAVRVETRKTALRAFRKRPLLRAARLDQRVREPADVEVASPRGFPVLVENLLRPRVGEEVLRRRIAEHGA